MSTPLGYRTGPWGPYAQQEAPTGINALRQQRPRALWEAIPDDPDYRKYIPIEYRLDAKRIVGDLAQDLHRGQSAHVWLELAHLGLAVPEMFAETSALVGALGLAGPGLALAASFAALGAGYQEAAEKIAEDWSARGYSRGVVMGANRRSPRLVREYYGYEFFKDNPFFPAGPKVAKANHNAGLVAGYLHGRALSVNRHAIFWHDLGRRMSDQAYRGPSSQWTSRDWHEWYAEAAVTFRRDHLTA
jgi:hypothetical protein